MSINLFRNKSISSDKRKHYRLGSAVMMAAISAAAVTGLVGLVLTKMWNVNFNALNATTDRNQAMQYVLNSADLVRATRYVNLSSSPRVEIPGTDFEREVIVVQDPNFVDRKQATIRVYKGNSDVPVASIVVKKSRVNEVLYDSIGNNTDGAMTQEACSRIFAQTENVFSKDEAYQIFITNARAESLYTALEEMVVNNYLTMSEASNLYRLISDSYSKGDTDSLLTAIRSSVSTNKANINTNAGNITTNRNNISTNASNIASNTSSINTNKSNISTNTTNISLTIGRVKTLEDAQSLYLKITDAANTYLAKTVAESTYAKIATAVTHTANTAVGSSTRPVYIAADGKATVLSGTVGSTSKPIYLKDGIFTETSGGSGVPTGTIVMWSGTTIPDGWALCNGSNGTPDLRDRFVVGAGSSYSLKATGGAATVTLTLSQIPSHSHSFSWPRGDCGWSNGSGNTWWGSSFNASSSTSSAGGGGAHENRPPYYALYYIMKL